ncbi:hypothetical protein [Methyloglobulus sp.]|uniref:hypothetical protein n=1 Tax=Methyloglobulus sp. TaxID=2518622 RepID=UPI0032B7357B
MKICTHAAEYTQWAQASCPKKNGLFDVGDFARLIRPIDRVFVIRGTFMSGSFFERITVRQPYLPRQTLHSGVALSGGNHS